MEKVILKAEARSATGKKVAKDLRAKGLIPANVYKGGKGALSLQISLDGLQEVLHTKAGENVIITLKISGEGSPKDKTVLIKEIQREPVKDTILHVDFNEISLTETLKVNVPLASRGEPVGVKVDEGVLEHVIRELQVECLPTAIPEKIEVDVSNLKIGDAIHVKDVKVPEGVKVLNDPELIAMIVKPPKVEAPKEDIAEEMGEEPELIRKKKEEVPEGEEAEGAVKPKEADKPAAGKEAKKE
ncbi:MAG: 50S ribosomal protein L25 [Candidatus Omnitrophica bacterium]|nr:50S ribosomal protein L25 [Candidatus Omnitrophota bacterium]